MPQNNNLANAKNAKNDEFYTQYADIQKEVNAYLDCNPDVFRGKTILLPCDDPEWSNFTKFFAQNFEFFGLKKLISTSYAIESKNYKTDWQPTLFETENPRFKADKTRICGKIFTLDHDTNASGRIDIDDLEWDYLEGDGDFRSAEVTALRDEADIIITNPPFSLLREFIAWLIESGKQFLIIGNQNIAACKEVFPLIQNNILWLGTNCGHTLFAVPESATIPEFYDKDDRKKLSSNGYKIDEYGRLWRNLGNICWFTNIDHGRRHQPLQLMTEAENIKYSKHPEVRGVGYQSYDNYDAIEVPYYDAIPKDYPGVMGVPISFLDKYCPEQFEILGSTQRGCHDLVPDIRKYDDYWECRPDGTKTGSSGGKTNENGNLLKNDGVHNYFENVEGRQIQSTYSRVFIRFKKQ